MVASTRFARALWLAILLLLGVLVVFASPCARAAGPELLPKDVPDPLKPWTDWVLRG